MTDNRTTEKLRKLLEERGIKWRETINHANCIFTWWESPTFGIVHAMDNEDGETLFMACLNSCDFTPEQAIAATLGNHEIVRCRDCKYGIDSGKYCAEGCADSWDWRNVEPDGFCAWGERRDA